MQGEWANYWALIVAGLITAGVAVFVLFRLYQASVPGRLRANVRRLKACYRELDVARRRALRAARRLERIRERAAKVPPRRLREAEEALDDARALEKIATDRVQVAENHVRLVIVEEYPPDRQEPLRAKYLRPADTDTRPFTF